jgi:hypothetical protein
MRVKSCIGWCALALLFLVGSGVGPTVGQQDAKRGSGKPKVDELERVKLELEKTRAEVEELRRIAAQERDRAEQALQEARKQAEAARREVEQALMRAEEEMAKGRALARPGPAEQYIQAVVAQLDREKTMVLEKIKQDRAQLASQMKALEVQEKQVLADFEVKKGELLQQAKQHPGKTPGHAGSAELLDKILQRLDAIEKRLDRMEKR